MAVNQQQLDGEGSAPRTVRARRHRRVTVKGGGGLSALAFGLFIVLIIFTLLSMPTRIPILAALRPTVLLVGLITLLILMSSGQGGSKDTSKTTRYLTILILYMIVTIPFVQWPGSVLRFGLENFAKAVVFFYFAVYLVNNFERLRVFVYTILICQLIRILEPLYLHITTGYWGSAAHMGGGEFMARLSGAPSDIINPNGLAFVVLTALPFMHYLLGGSPRVLPKLIYIALLPPVLYAFLLTGSRSGMIGLLVVLAVIFLRSRHRILFGVVALVSIVVALGVMTGDMKDRYLSIADSESRHAETSQGRIHGVVRDLEVGLQRPIFGHGVGTSAEALANRAGVWQISHNLYTEVLIELGLIGLLLYLAVLISIFTNVRAVGLEKRRMERFVNKGNNRSLSDRVGFYERCADATLAWFVMCLVFSLASYGLSEFYWYMVAGISVALRSLIITELKSIGDAMSISANGPVSRASVSTALKES